MNNLTISNSYAAGTVTSYTDTTNIGLRTIAASYAGGLIGAKDDNVQYTATSAAYWCNKMIWLNQDEDYKKPYINDFDKEKTFTEMEALPLFNTTYWKESSKSWPILKHVPAGGLLDDVLGLLASLDSSIGHQSLAEVSIQLAGFDVYYADVIENKLMNRGDFDYFASYQYNAGVGNDAEYHIASHAIAHKELSNGKTIVLVAIMGTGTEHDGLDSIGKWVSNFWKYSLCPLNWFCTSEHFGTHHGFRTATDTVETDLLDYLDDIDLYNSTTETLDSNVIFLVTGHSRGAAVGNLLSARLDDVCSDQSRVFSYNYAVPNVINIILKPIDQNNYGNILNICNVWDLVPHIPNEVFWQRYGEDIWFFGDSTPGILMGAHRAELYQKEIYKGQLF